MDVSLVMKSPPWPYPGYRTSDQNQEVLDHVESQSVLTTADLVFAESGCTGAAEARSRRIMRFNDFSMFHVLCVSAALWR